MCCLKLLVKINNVLLIIFPLTYALALTQDGLKVFLKLVRFVLCPVQVLFDNPLQSPNLLQITSISMDPLLQHYYSITFILHLLLRHDYVKLQFNYNALRISVL